MKPKPNGTNENYKGAALQAVAGAFGVSQLAVHCLSALSTPDPQMSLMHGIAFLYDVFLLAIAVAALGGLQRRVFTRWRRITHGAAMVFLFAVGLTLASYPFLLTEFLGFPVNLFAVGSGVAGFFLTNILSWREVLAMAAAGTLGFIALRRWFRVPLPRKRMLFWALISLSLLGIVPSFAGWKFMATLPNPLVYSAQETLKDWFVRSERVVPRPERPAILAEKTSIRLEPSPLEGAVTFQYDHILLLVMETVNESDFAQRFIGKKDGFYSKVEDRAAYFNRYYTTNLDSYTSLLAMLTSAQVPYRAYDVPGYFTNVNAAPNMIGALGAKGWESLFVCTSKYQPFVPIRDVWSRKVLGPDLPNKDDYKSIAVNPVEAATEDKAAIPSIVSFMKAHRRTVIMHEMVVSHSPRWMRLTGKSHFAYYDEFFQTLYDDLLVAELAEKTLFVIVADHGERTDSTLPENYHVPLLVVGKGVRPSTNEEMFSHRDLQQIVGHYLSSLPLPSAREDVLVIGHSGRWVYGLITTTSSHMFIDALDGVVLGQKGNLLPRRVFDRFQTAIDSFARYQ